MDFFTTISLLGIIIMVIVEISAIFLLGILVFLVVMGIDKFLRYINGK